MKKPELTSLPFCDIQGFICVHLRSSVVNLKAIAELGSPSNFATARCCKRVQDRARFTDLDETYAAAIALSAMV